ncbi:hypothetical protein [Enhygromyxa salina]|uniref:Uncharacterized protein n=1 Tax=Enhygromyxa salina TaxID=215803 RepID=A0A2S9YV17_9BACT|nr:hypothetical protein [Enhygromyxa salina]PRQ08951.1 hypothetical protein ENSA7_13500 [Enhygromyxa salina]
MPKSERRPFTLEHAGGLWVGGVKHGPSLAPSERDWVWSLTWADVAVALEGSSRCRPARSRVSLVSPRVMYDAARPAGAQPSFRL